jgi:hypothetical protein
VHVVPARDAQLAEQDNLVKLGYPMTFIKKAPTFSPEGELAQVEREEVNAYFGRITSLRRTSSIEEIRPEEEANNSQNSGEESGTQHKSERSVEDRLNLERSDQAFFNQKGFVTDSMPEVDASQELLRTQKEAKVRNRDQEGFIGLSYARKKSAGRPPSSEAPRKRALIPRRLNLCARTSMAHVAGLNGMKIRRN